MVNKDRQRLDCQRSQAAQFFCANYSREKRYLLILSRDLAEEVRMINELGVEKARSLQKFYDFLCDFERLKELMNEFRWSGDSLAANGIDFKALRKLYFAVC